MPEMFVALGAVLSLTPDKSLLKTAECIDIPMYIQRREQWNSMLAKWNEIAAPYIKQAQEYVQSVAKRDQRELDVKSKIIGKNGRSIQLPAS
jgi:hypothetical protein